MSVTYPMDENEHDVIGEEYKGEASDRESDIESDESRGSPTEEIHQMCGLRGQKKRPAVSESEESDEPISKLSSSSKAKRFGNQSKRHKSTVAGGAKSSVPNTPRVTTPKTSTANTPKLVPRNALQKGICHLRLKPILLDPPVRKIHVLQ